MRRGELIDKDNFENSLKIENSPFLGCFIADRDGKTLVKFEIFPGALESFLKIGCSEQRKKYFDIELIPMFISALEKFSQEINIKELSKFKLEGMNIKLHVIFEFDNFSIIFFLKPEVNIKLVEEKIKNYFTYLFKVYKEDFNSSLKIYSLAFISHLELLGQLWLEELNETYTSLISKKS